jgi:hypothetical protein
VVGKGARPRARARGAKRLAKRRAFMVLAAVQNVRNSIVIEVEKGHDVALHGISSGRSSQRLGSSSLV